MANKNIIFNTSPAGNKSAQHVGAEYIKLTISTVESIRGLMLKYDKIAQPLLAYMDLLLIFAKKYPEDANLLIKKQDVQEWKTIFNDWFERCGRKIPAKYRDGIKANGDELFKELEQYGY